MPYYATLLVFYWKSTDCKNALLMPYCHLFLMLNYILWDVKNCAYFNFFQILLNSCHVSSWLVRIHISVYFEYANMFFVYNPSLFGFSDVDI